MRLTVLPLVAGGRRRVSVTRGSRGRIMCETTAGLGYELFYAGGGHGGPFWTLEAAQEAAKARLRGCATMPYLDIVQRDAAAIGGYGHRVQRMYRAD